ncbi:hemerythrin domain-containing protein [Bacillus sp. FJAT-28004]|uniref:hemerythrin domain-containing protein n=1 Tax=Bacillus sp. FJAT-28004 TaxID=1679165 RepID=UPI000B265E35|nr:hemerythrin domain-containing protein [Bacillus sp. FJAT-28004]
MEHQCASKMFSEGANEVLCEPLARLKKEHDPLRKQMEDLAFSVNTIVSENGSDRWQLELVDLEIKVETFMKELGPHSEQEEGVLFPMMANYIGRTTGPIAVMEYEHDQAKENLKIFQVSMKKLDLKIINLNRAKEIALYVHKAYTILTDHFLKEENILFPLAEKMLSAEDKEQLLQKLKDRQI